MRSTTRWRTSAPRTCRCRRRRKRFGGRSRRQGTENRRVGKGARRAPCPRGRGTVGTLRFAHPTRYNDGNEETRDVPTQELPPARRHPGGAAAVPRRPVDRREELPPPSARRRSREGPLRPPHQCPFARSRVLHLRTAAPPAP